MMRAGREAGKYSVAIWPAAEDLGFRARCMEIPGADAVGRTPEIALRGCYQAIQEHLDHSRHLGFKPPATGAAEKWFAQKRSRLIASLMRRRKKLEDRKL